MTLLCVPILADDVDAALADVGAARQAGADLVEFRVDHLFHAGDPDAEAREAREIARLVSESPLPCILTCRPTSEGGDYDGEDDSRIAMFERVCAGVRSGERPPRYLDVELAAYTRSANLRQKVDLCVAHPGQAREVETSLVLSSHDFDGRPADLLRRVARMGSEPAAAVHKIAHRARSIRDNLELFDLLAERERPMIALAMGEFGLMSRVLAPKFGGFLTFASLRPQSTTAPGQPTIDELLNLYRFRAIGPDTRVYGVVGWPVAQSLSPLVHNAGFHAPGVETDAAYLPLPIPPEWEHFKASVGALVDHPRLGFGGASVTSPHKEHLVRLARERGWEVDPLAARIGAANTLVVGPAGAMVTNTDAPAAAECLERAMGWLKGRRIGVLGAGGVARAVATALADRGAVVVVSARSKDRADRLVADVRAASTGADDGAGARVSAAPWDRVCGACCEAFVNCTPLGMAGGPDERASPIAHAEFEKMAPGTVVFDTVYNPLRTPLLEGALDHSMTIVDGASMFVRQAEAQIELWTGRPAPAGLFDRLVRARLRA